MVGADAIKPCRNVRNLGIYIDSDLSMRTHVARTVSACFAALRQIKSIRRSVTRPVLTSLVVALVLTRLDYGCATLAGLPERLLGRLQSVINAAARLIFRSARHDHITPLLHELHWLRIRERIDFRLAVLTFRCLHGLAPPYLASDLQLVSAVESRRRLRSADRQQLVVPSSNRKTIGDRAFTVAAPRVWNSLSSATTSLQSLPAFRKALKTELFARSFRD